MRTFIAKMNDVEIAPDADLDLVVPLPHKGERPPDPRPGDLLLVWFDDGGLIGEGIVRRCDGQAGSLAMKLAFFSGHPRPRVTRDHLEKADRLRAEIASRMKVARTERGGPRLLAEGDIEALDRARREKPALALAYG